MAEIKPNTLPNLFAHEVAIQKLLEPLVGDGMVFPGALAQDISNEMFSEMNDDEDRVAIVIESGGIQADPINARNACARQKIKLLWQIIVVCPRDTYRTIGGIKMMEVISTLKGANLDDGLAVMQIVNDERDFNRPEYEHDLVWLPMMFSASALV